jgi:hypothetical protein
MKITRRKYNRHTVETVEMSVADLVEFALDEQREGSVEQAQARADTAIKTLARLISALHAAGGLSPEQLKEIIGGWPYDLQVEE